MYSLNNIDIKQFLTQYWQKQPLVIKQGFANFIDPLDENDLAGLSQEPSVDSRIVSQTRNSWEVSHGPFEDINAYCVGAWSLLVQSVDHFIPEADELMRAFDFIPHWRMDDLMVSFSNKDAGVGPHLDQYDVFIIQGKGSRRWKVGLPGSFEAITPHKDLSQITGFQSVIDQVLMPGDIIYIPANHPHNGIALEECLNYSVGFRAPSQQEMLSSFADFAIDNNLFTARYTDAKLAPREFSGEIKQHEIARFKEMLQQLLETDHFTNWTAHFLSQSRDKQEFDEQFMQNFSLQEVTEKLQAGVHFFRSPGIKAVFVEQQPSSIQDFTFYLQGEAFSVPHADKALVTELLNKADFCLNDTKLDQSSMFFTQLMTTLVNSGYWFPED
ncbi:cupin domain-containing protein [uncultured Paraglaciecola sp.]|uniref:cupin domain-containing protein n=1 Tax=uncultured Paraglaciecola sp. TaxID=1765024 RepID=UPI0030DB66C3|tara:strand:+ start:50147 stop:51298 length:1152 start_codon:yes stop_codon:yes gene_type:complete